MDLTTAYRLLGAPDATLNERERAVKIKLLSVLGRKSATIDTGGAGLVKIPDHPQNPKGWDDKTVVAAVKRAGFKVVNSIPDMRPGHEDAVYTSQFSNPVLPIEKVVLGQVLQAGKFYKRFQKEISMLLIKASAFMVSGGTQAGFFARITSGFAQEVTCELPEWVSAELVDAANVFLPWKHNKHTSLSEEGRANLEYSPNLVASYGLPYPEFTKRDYIPVGDKGEEKAAIMLMYEEAEEILRELVKGEQSFAAWTAKPRGRAFMAVQLKNKVELIAREKWDIKVRPYGNYSAPLAYLYSQLWAAYSSGVEMAHEENQSISLIGLSWIGGGGMKIYRLIKSVKPGQARFTSYADDFFVIVRTLDDKTYLFFFDIKQMDTSITIVIGAVAAALAQSRLTDEGRQPEHFPNDFRFVLAAWKYSAFRPEVVFAKGVVGRPTSTHLISGVPGTSRVDEVASFIICADNILEGTFHDVADLDDLKTRIPIFVSRTKRLGFVVHEETLDPQEFHDGETVVGPILGQSLYYDLDAKEYFPGPQKPERCIASLIYPKKQISKPKDRIAYAMIVSYGIAVGAAAAHEVIYEACKAIWEYGRDQGIIPDIGVMGDQMEVGFETMDYVSMVFDEEGETKPFPERQAFKDMMFTTYNPAQIVHTTIPLDVLDDIEQKIGSISLSTDWGDMEELAALKKLAAGVVSVDATKGPKADVERMGIYIPMSDLTSPPGKRPEDPEIRKKKDEAFALKIANQKLAKATALNMGEKVKAKDKKQIYQKKFADYDKQQRDPAHDHKHVELTLPEAEEAAEEQARKAAGAPSERAKQFLIRRITALEDRMNDVTQTLSEEDRDNIIKEVMQIDKQLQRI